MLIDITHPLIPGESAVWPNDTPLTREVIMDVAKGDVITLSTLRSTTHLGTHADGPNHYGQGACGVGEMPLDHYIGPCRVIRVNAAPHSRVAIDMLGDTPIDVPRILLDTGTFTTIEHFNEAFAALDPDLIDFLADQGVRTIGLDSPSVDILDSKDLPTHARCLARDVAIIEALRLQDVPPGLYELMAQPLKLMGVDGSPVRAVLRTTDQSPT